MGNAGNGTGGFVDKGFGTSRCIVMPKYAPEIATGPFADATVLTSRLPLYAKFAAEECCGAVV
jgi:hypothetical protein